MLVSPLTSILCTGLCMGLCTGLSLGSALSVPPTGLASPMLESRSAAVVGQRRPGRVELAAPLVRVPFGRVDRRVSVAVLVDGQGPYHFIVDTGASGEGRIDIGIAEELGLKRVGRVIQDDTTGTNSAIRDEVRIDTLRIAGATFRDVVVTASDYGWISGDDELPVSGILGLGLFADLLLTVDYPGYALELSRGELPRNDPHVARFDPRDGLCSVPIAVGDTRLEAILDTGSAAGLLVPDSWRARMETTREPRLTARGRLANNAFTVRSAPLRDSLRVAGHDVDGLHVGYVSVDLMPNVGYEVLRRFVLTFDQRNRRVRLAERPELDERSE